MAQGISFLFNAGLQFDQSQVNDAVSKMTQAVGKTPPIKIQSAVGEKVDTGNAQKYIDEIERAKGSIDSIIVKQKTLKNQAGETYTALTEMTTKWRGENGLAYESVNTLSNGIKGLDKGYSVVNRTKGEIDVRAQLKMTDVEYSKKLAQFDQINKKAVEWENRSQTMGTKEKTSIQASTSALQAKIEKYKELLKAGDSAGAGNLAREINKQNVELDKNIALSKRAATGLRSWGDSIKNAVMQTMSYTLSIGLVRAAQQLLNQTLQFTIDLNKEMTNIQVLQAEGAQTPEEIRALAMEFNGLGKELGATTIEIAKGSVEWLRQGKTIQETSELLRASTMLSKLGNLDAASSTEYLTAVLNSYRMGAEEATGVVDKLIAVDNAAATSAKELATALKYSASGASEAGVSLEQLVSYIAVISSTTRQNAESIGQGIGS